MLRAAESLIGMGGNRTFNKLIKNSLVTFERAILVCVISKEEMIQ